jgi:tryptophan synthase alpha chain
MGRIEDAFARRAAEGKKTLVTYLCVGDPDEAESVELAVACADAGADVLELGCPFSDPTADGPAIARASQRAATEAARQLALDIAAALAARPALAPG